MEVDEYLFKEGTWVLNNNIELKEKVNFVHNGTEWLFDPTVTKSLASEDYLILENWVKANKDAGYMDAKYGNSEYWFGDINFDNNLQRCIALDIRYVLFILEKLGDCGHLIKEMNIIE